MQPVEIPPEVLLAVKIHVEGEEVGEVGLQVFRGGEVGVADKGRGIDALGDIHQLTQESADPWRAVPANDVRRDLVSYEVRRHGRMPAARFHRFSDRASDALGQLLRVEETDVLRPGDPREHAQVAVARQVQ